MIYVIPAIFLVVFVFAAIKRVKLYSEFRKGLRRRLSLPCRLYPALPQFL